MNNDKSEYALIIIRMDNVMMLRFNRKDAAETVSKWLHEQPVGYVTTIVSDPPKIGQ